MIHESEVMPLVLDTCPSFVEPWRQYTSEAAFDPHLLIVNLGELAIHVVQLAQVGKRSEFPGLFAAIERLVDHGDGYVSEAAVVGFLEGLQYVASHAGLDGGVFVPYLGWRSRQAWKQLANG